MFLKRTSDGAEINPATEDGNLATIAANDFATEVTLAAVNTKLSDGNQTTKITNGTHTAEVTDGNLHVRLFNSAGDGFEDSMYPEALVTLPLEHHRVHDARSYSYHDILAMGNGATQDYLVTTPNSAVRCHFGYSIDFNDGAGTFGFYEGSDRTGTTAQTIYNRERNSANTTTITIHKGHSSGAIDGTLIATKRAGSGKTLAGNAGTTQERILKANTKYIFRVKNETTTTNNVSITMDFYET
jgi:hypothetical protein